METLVVALCLLRCSGLRLGLVGVVRVSERRGGAALVWGGSGHVPRCKFLGCPVPCAHVLVGASRVHGDVQ